MSGLRWLLVVLNLCLAGVAALATWTYFGIPPSGIDIPPIDLTHLRNKETLEAGIPNALDRYQVILVTMVEQEAPPTNRPTHPLEPKTPRFQEIIESLYQIAGIALDPDGRCSAVFLKTRKDQHHTDRFEIGDELGLPQHTILKALERIEITTNEPSYEVYIENDHGERATLFLRTE